MVSPIGTQSTSGNIFAGNLTINFHDKFYNQKIRFILAIRIPRLKPWVMIKIRKKPWSAVPDNYRGSVIISPVFF
jgi:hypothetical protein